MLTIGAELVCTQALVLAAPRLALYLGRCRIRLRIWWAELRPTLVALRLPAEGRSAPVCAVDVVWGG